jgi:alpha-N-arabinofuranosidase
MSTSKAQVFIDRNRTIAPISPLLFGGFAEHMGRCVYEGIYDPKSPQSDERGFRKDVLAALRDQAYSVIRYPGGNFLSGYNWLDGVGPKEQRPRVRELAWQSLETNQFGANEFVEFCASINAAPMLGVNVGTGTIRSASDLVEYCNAPGGTRWSDLRASHGYRDPHNVRYWCVGNEMDGPWQIGHLDAASYGNKALEAAKMMKWQDPTIKTILCGSSGYSMPTFPEWDRTALEIAWEHMDYLSMHCYVSNNENDTDSYLANSVLFERYVETLEGTLRYVKARRRSKHDIYLSWDEWQVWYMLPPMQGNWTEAPHLAEEIYNLEDALGSAMAKCLPAESRRLRLPVSRRSSTRFRGCIPAPMGFSSILPTIPLSWSVILLEARRWTFTSRCLSWKRNNTVLCPCWMSLPAMMPRPVRVQCFW